MPEIRFTDAKIASLNTTKNRDEYRDPRYPNLVLRVTKSGTKSWVYRQKRKKSGRRPGRTLGRYPAVSYKNVLRAYREEQERVENGLPDPDIHRQIQELEAELAALKRKAGDVLTFDDLAKDYLERYAKKKKKTWKHDEYLLAKDPIPAWSGKPVDEIRRSDVVRLLDDVVSRAPSVANRLQRLLHRVWSWAMSVDLVELNPCSGIERPAKESPRERILDDQEIALFWSIFQGQVDVGQGGLAPVLADAACFCLVTAQRRSEVALMTWDELSEDSQWWMLSAQRTKADRPHLIYLSPLARALVHKQRESPLYSSTYVFPSPKLRGRAISPIGLTNAFGKLNKALLEAGTIEESACLHDLRATAATGMARLGVDPRIVSRVLNHAESSVTARHYNLYQYRSEIQDALTRWSDHLTQVLRRLPAGG